ncbi:thioredoxin-like domain-containing protein [Dysgonomonas sp. Marseille-P4361]|uniref:thioredoxin-like domain-containing protein n=1 Tax=Dysgonomonas sp. Marseille-P4361 TaxID=2161820 RepID=UPI002100C42C|nr:thioredoxin-like domain-containing protein [Dysgonomonas sp. Marseille-P4361]
MKYRFLLILSLLLYFKVEAQINTNNNTQSFQLEAVIPTQKGKKIYLGQYWNSGTYAIDSTFISDEGIAKFSSPESKLEGQYFLYIKPDYQVDFLIGSEQNNIKFTLNENDIKANKVSGSKDTEVLWQYIQMTYNADRLREQIENSNISDKEKSAKEKELNKAQKDIDSYKKALFKQNTDLWGALYIKGLEPTGIPYPEPKTQEEASENRKYGKLHYFDNINLTDPRFWRTNYFENYIDTYLQQWVEASPDSLASAASLLVKKTIDNDICFERMLSKLINESIKSLKMGDKNIWSRLYEDYIMGKNISWIDSTQYLKLGQMYEKIKNNRIGMYAHNLRVQTISGDSINTNGIDSKYTILYFYSPSCGYCVTEVPKMYNELYSKYKDKGLEIIAFNVGSSKEDWIKFINDNKLTGWINCADLNYKSQYWMHYDVSGTPSVLVLDKDKRIIAKKLDLENLQKLFNYLYQ